MSRSKLEKVVLDILGDEEGRDELRRNLHDIEREVDREAEKDHEYAVSRALQLIERRSSHTFVSQHRSELERELMRNIKN